MKYKLLVLTCCIMMAMFLTGCLGGGGGSAGFLEGGSFDVADSGGGDGGGGDGGGDINPEPATMAMIGTGMLAYGIMRRKRKK